MARVVQLHTCVRNNRVEAFSASTMLLRTRMQLDSVATTHRMGSRGMVMVTVACVVCNSKGRSSHG